MSNQHHQTLAFRESHRQSGRLGAKDQAALAPFKHLDSGFDEFDPQLEDDLLSSSDRSFSNSQCQ